MNNVKFGDYLLFPFASNFLLTYSNKSLIIGHTPNEYICHKAQVIMFIISISKTVTFHLFLSTQELDSEQLYKIPTQFKFSVLIIDVE